MIPSPVDKSLGGCGFCEQPAVTVINGVSACMDHLEDALRPVGEVAGKLRELVEDYLPIEAIVDDETGLPREVETVQPEGGVL